MSDPGAIKSSIPVEQYVNGEISRSDAISALRGMGFSAVQAAMLVANAGHAGGE